jgi:hypothetical protein
MSPQDFMYYVLVFLGGFICLGLLGVIILGTVASRLRTLGHMLTQLAEEIRKHRSNP